MRRLFLLLLLQLSFETTFSQGSLLEEALRSNNVTYTVAHPATKSRSLFVVNTNTYIRLNIPDSLKALFCDLPVDSILKLLSDTLSSVNTIALLYDLKSVNCLVQSMESFKRIMVDIRLNKEIDFWSNYLKKETKIIRKPIENYPF